MKQTHPKLLVIDNDEVFNFIIETHCRSVAGNCQIQFRTRAADALEYLKSISQDDFPDIIFLDLNMPIMDGFDFLKAYYESAFPNKARIFMVSSSVYESDKTRALQYKDVEDLIIKPVSKNFIQTLIGNYN
ncbi:MAG: response regulator [Microscillaceae bacterium]|nr:response regulator [Microscillaceae bacterium]